MVRHSLSLFCLLCTLLLASCQLTSDERSNGDTLTLHYAHNLLMVEYADGIDVQLRNPWDTTKVLHRYWLTREEGDAPFPDATVVIIPLRKAAVFTAVHCSLIDELGCLSSIGGVCEPEYIHNRSIHDGLKKDSIIDLGNGMNPNLERIMEVDPDALMPSPFQDSGGYGRLESVGIPIIECADYMEVSPLARAEWMKFYGILFGVREKAEAQFARVEQEYLALKEKARTVNHRPRLMVERASSGTWYTPGGNSTLGIMYQDAGADYLWSDTPESGSLTLSVEHIMQRAMDADIWLLKYNQDTEMTYAQLASDNPIYTEFQPFQTRNIYACNTHTSGFYEETPFHPERLLRNLLQIFHPELSVSTNNSYFCKLKE